MNSSLEFKNRKYDLKSKTNAFFSERLDQFSFDEAMGVLLEEKDSIFVRMNTLFWHLCKKSELKNNLI